MGFRCTGPKLYCIKLGVQLLIYSPYGNDLVHYDFIIVTSGVSETRGGLNNKVVP